MTFKTAVLLSKERYLEAIRSAEVKDPTKNYRLLKSDRSIILLYNPATRDGKFTTKLLARTFLGDGYYEAWPHIGYAQTLAENLKNLEIYGWPAYELEGV